MANILYARKGKNWQLPGLPYEDAFRYAKPIIFDDIPDDDDLKKVITEADNETLVSPWSVYVVRGFRNYIPSTFRRITKNMKPEELSNIFNYTPADLDIEDEGRKMLLQLQSELDAKSATVDAAIIHNRMNLYTVANKVHVLNRLYKIAEIYGFLGKKDYPLLLDRTYDNNRENWYGILSDAKKMFIEFLKEIPCNNEGIETRIKSADVSEKELRERFVYVDWLKEVLGDNLTGVLLYGSASMTDDPSRHSDFDNWVKVRDVEAAHKALKGTCPIVYDGRVMTECKNGSSIATGELEGLTDHEQGKHLGIFLFPDDDEFSIKYIRFLHDSTEFLDHSRVLYGDFRFPVVGLDEVIERGVSHAYIKLKTIAGALNWAYLAPEKLLGKPTLYEFIVKNLRFFEHHSLNATEGHRYRNKETLNEALYQKGMFIPPYMNEKKWIQVSLIYAMIKVLELQRDLFLSGREQNLHFLDEIQIPQINRNIVGFYDDIT